MDNQAPTVWTTGYLPNGMKVSYTLPITDPMNAYQEALAFTNKLLADGLLLSEPGLEAGEESETIITVMRREKSDGTPIIDFYPAWGAGTDEPYGTYKYIHKYMNDDAEIGEFLKVSGFKRLEDVPLYEAQAPLKRSIAKPHNKETAVPTPFKVVRKQGKEKIGSDGKPYKPWDLVRYDALAMNTPATAQNGANGASGAITEGAWNETAVKQLIVHYSGKLTTEQLLAALKVTRFGEWTGGVKAAYAAAEAFLTLAEAAF